MELLINKFIKQFNRSDYKIAFSPYRIAPLGAHVDHQKGLISGFAIDHGIHLIYAPRKDGFINLVSGNFPDTEYFNMNNIIDYIPGSWGNYIRGAIRALSKYYLIRIGIEGIASGSLPIGGLSSSAAVSTAYLLALADVNNIKLSEQELIQLVYDIEHDYIGLNNGILDQSVNVLSKKDHLLFMDTLSNEYKLLEKPKNMQDFEVVIVYSGIAKALIATDYNLRVNECKAAAWFLTAMNNETIKPFNLTYLRNIPEDIYNLYKNHLPGVFLKRAEHFYTENQRVTKGIEYWSQGDLKSFGKLVFESGESSIHNYESGSPELIDLFYIMKETPGMLGARFSGGGYRGCLIGIIDPHQKESIRKFITEKYLVKYPQFTDVFQIDFCQSDDGARIL